MGDSLGPAEIRRPYYSRKRKPMAVEKAFDVLIKIQEYKKNKGASE